MANRFFSPNQQFSDTTGLPYAGGSLTFYASGTSTPLATYSDRALSIANTNPVALDSAGRAGNVFLQNLAYKVVLADVNSNIIWTFDPVYSSDFSTVAQFQSGLGSPNGVLAGSAGSATIPASAYWDATNNILYICTQTGTTSTAVWTAVNASSAAAVVPAPQGYLTLTSATPVIPTDVTAATSIFYTPYVGNIIPVYNGTSFTPTVFAEISCALVSAHTANSIFDLFVFNNSGVLTLVTGPAWNTSTAGSGARGSGAGTTQLSRVNGIWVNTVSMTGRNGSTTYSIPANQATYVGSFYSDAAAGQVSCYRTFGQNRKWGVWNAYNRVPTLLQIGDATGSWTYNSATIRASNNAPASYSSAAFNAGSGTACNGGGIFMGLPEEISDIRFFQTVVLSANASTMAAKIYVGVNSVTVNVAGKIGGAQMANSGGTTNSGFNDMVAEYMQQPTLGLTNVACLEAATSGVPTLQGAASGMLMAISYRA